MSDTNNLSNSSHRGLGAFYDKFGRCDKCQDIYWEMRHTYYEDDGGSYYSAAWYSVGRYAKYENDESEVMHDALMKQYRKKLLQCLDCPRNDKKTPRSLKDQSLSRISVIIGTIAIAEMRRSSKFDMDMEWKYFDHELYNKRVRELPILDGMITALEGKPCTWECSPQRKNSSQLMSFDD